MFLQFVIFKIHVFYLSQGTSVDQYLSGAVLDDRASAYFLSCENYERVVHSISNDPGSGVVPVDTPVADALLATPGSFLTKALFS